MKTSQAIRRIHLIGICGTAMASLAGMLKEKGLEVRGSDRNVYPPMSVELARMGIEVFPGYDERNLNWNPHLVVIGNAMSRGNAEVERVLDERIHYASMPEVVREMFLRGRTPLVVAGTHGKTTTTSMLAWIFECAGLKPNFLIGGVAQNFGTSFKLGGGPHFIIEGDEYDTAFFDKGPKFLHYLPDTVLLNNVEFDHADIYPNFEAVKTSFRRLINIIPRRGALVANWGDPVVRELAPAAFCALHPFFVSARGDKNFDAPNLRLTALTAANLRTDSAGSLFTLLRGEESLGEWFIPLFGEFNVGNALGAIAASYGHGIPTEAIRRALESFKSVRRRMEIRGCVDGVTVIDDFAHHPTAIRKTLEGIRARFPNARIWAIVEPRSATMRRRVIESELAEALKWADEIVLAELYAPERIPREQRLSPQAVVDSLLGAGKPARYIANAPDIVSRCAPLLKPGDVIAVFSNGGFDNIHEKFLSALQKEDARA